MDESTIELFRQETEEILQQMGLALTSWVESPSQENKQLLIRLVRLIYQGAVQMNLAAFEQPALQLIAEVQAASVNQNVPLSREQLRQITHLYTTLKQIDVTAKAPAPPHTFEEQVEVETQHPTQTEVEEIAHNGNEKSNALSQPDLNLNHVLVKTDLEAVLQEIEKSLDQLTGEALVQALGTHADTLMGWGKVLDWPKLVILAQHLTQVLDLASETAPAIAQSLGTILLVGLQALQRDALSTIKPQSSTEVPSLKESSSFPESSLPESSLPISTIGPNADHRKTAWEQKAPIKPPTPPARRLATDKRFMWQTGSLLFLVTSNSVQEILIPKQDQIIQIQSQPQLRWKNLSIPIINILDRLRSEASAIKPLNLFLKNSFSQSPNSEKTTEYSHQPMLVVQTLRGAIALEVDIEQFIREPELMLQTLEDAPAFCLGERRWNDQSVAVIDVLELLSSREINPLKSSETIPEPKTVSTISATRGLGTRPFNSTPLSAKPLATKPIVPATQILIVDDSRTVRALLQRTFEKASYKVLQAQDGLEAIVQLQKNPQIQLMVSDVEMPNLSGFELLNHCRRNRLWANLPIIMLSQCSTDQHRKLALQFGANAYVSKPYNEPQFLETVESLIHR